MFFTRSMNCELEFFQLFFTKEMLQEVVAHTNTYAHMQITQKSSSYTNKEGSWTSTNLEEIERLIAFLVQSEEFTLQLLRLGRNSIETCMV
jgi:hypothetical protein